MQLRMFGLEVYVELQHGSWPSRSSAGHVGQHIQVGAVIEMRGEKPIAIDGHQTRRLQIRIAVVQKIPSDDDARTGSNCRMNDVTIFRMCVG